MKNQLRANSGTPITHAIQGYSYLKGLSIPLLMLILISSCTKDLIPENNLETWAKNYLEKHQTVDHYKASDFCEMALAGIFKNEISLSSVATDSVFFYSDVYTDSYQEDDLVKISKELEANLRPHYEEKEILGCNVEIYQFKDKLLILSVLRERRDNSITQRSGNCEYFESHPFNSGQTTCDNPQTAASIFEQKFDNVNSDGCYLDNIPQPKGNPIPWNFMYLYRSAPNPASTQHTYTTSCQDINECIQRLVDGQEGMINILNCSNSTLAPKYCLYTGIPGLPGEKKLYYTDKDSESCLSASILDLYQERLADLANDFRDNNEYGLNSEWVPHQVFIQNYTDFLKSKKTHQVTYEYITFGPNPDGGPNNGGF